MPEVLDIVVRQRGARVVARDIAKIGVSADTTNRSLKKLETTLKTSGSTLQTLATREQTATRTTKALTGSVVALGGAAKRTRVSLTALGTGAAIVGGALAAGIGRPLLRGIQIAADFQKAMNLAGVVTQVDRGTAAFKRMEDAAKHLGLTTQFTSVQAAEAISNLGRLGFTAEEAIGALPTVLNAAAAGGLSLGDSARVVTNILRGFRLTVADLPEAVDAMSAAFTSSATDLADLSLSFRDVAPVAARFGQRFQDIVGILAALGDAGIKGQKAGIALRRIFINLVKDSEKANSVLRAAGVTIRDEVTGGFRPLIDILVDISKANLEAGQQIDLFGARALAASGILDASSGTLQTYAESITNQVGRASEIAATRLKGLSGGIVQLSSATQILGQEIIEAGLLQFLEKAIELTTAFVRILAQLPAPIKGVIGATLGLVALLGALTLKIGIVVIALGVLGSTTGLAGVSAGFSMVATAVKAFTASLLTNPIFLMVTAVVALSITLFRLRDNLFEVGGRMVTLRAIFEVAWERVSAVIKKATTAIAGHFAKMRRGFEILTGGSTEWVAKSLKNLDTFLAAFISVFISAGKLIASFVKRTNNALGGLFRDIGNFFLALPKAFSLAAQRKFGEAGQTLANAWSGGFTKAFEGFGKEITTTLLSDFHTVSGAVDKFFDDVETRTKANAARIATSGRKGGPTLPGGKPIIVGEPTNVGKSAKSAQTALDQLRQSILDLTSAEQQLIKAQKTLTDAIAHNLITATEAKEIYREFAEVILVKLQREVNPVATALEDQRDKLRALKIASIATGRGVDELADSQRRIKLATEEVLLQLPEFTSGLENTKLLTLSVRKGFEGFADSIGSEFELISGAVQKTFDGALSAVENFVTTGKGSFREFALSVIADIQKVVLKLIALQAVRAFEQRAEKGGFFTALFGGRLEATQRQPSPEVAGAIEQIGTAANPASSVIKNAENEPIPARLLDPEAPGIVGLRDPIVGALTGPQGVKNTIVEQFQQLDSTIKSLGAQIQSAGSKGGLPQVGAIGQLEASNTAGQTAQTSAADANTGKIMGLNKAGFAAMVGVTVAGLNLVANSIAREKGTEKQAGIFGAIGAALGGIAGFFLGGPGGAAVGAGLGQSAGSLLGASLQEGGPVQPGKAFLVGEKGRELFVPPTTGTVVPNDMLGGTPPEIKVNIVNVDDARSVPEAMATREGEQTIMNVITRNRGQLRELIS